MDEASQQYTNEQHDTLLHYYTYSIDVQHHKYSTTRTAPHVKQYTHNNKQGAKLFHFYLSRLLTLTTIARHDPSKALASCRTKDTPCSTRSFPTTAVRSR